MKKNIATILILAFSIALFLPSTALTTYAIIPGEDTVPVTEEKIYCNATLSEDFADDRILVVLSNSSSLSLNTYDISDFPEIMCSSVENLTSTATALVNASLQNIDISQEYSANATGLVFNDFYTIDTEKFHQILCIYLSSTGKEKVLDAIAKLEQRADILYVGPDYALTLYTTTTTDTYYSSQWTLPNIKLPQAWDIETGSFSVEVGIIDTGIDGDHPDLVNRVNVGKSRDFSYGGCSTLTTVTDPHGHGTHVAGIVGAQCNNSIGIAGICWYTRLISLRVFDEYGRGYSSYVAKAIDYATDYGIPILNFSGGWRPLYHGSYYDCVLESSISNYPGLFVCAAGNDGSNLDSALYNLYPAKHSLPNLITVGASKSNNTTADFSNYGATTVDVFAPGNSILSCYPADKCQNGTHNTESSTHVDIGYHFMSGTSMAAPHVAGLAALMLAKNPNLTPSQIKSYILNTADVRTALEDLCVCDGRINAYEALLAVS